jgi:hypothetical protein
MDYGDEDGPAIRMKPQPESSIQEVLAGLVERVTFHNVENGFCVLRAKARGHRELVTDVRTGDAAPAPTTTAAATGAALRPLWLRLQAPAQGCPVPLLHPVQNSRPR